MGLIFFRKLRRVDVGEVNLGYWWGFEGLGFGGCMGMVGFFIMSICIVL